MIDFSVYYPREKDVFARKCPGCGTLYYPAPMVCKKCHSRRDPSGAFFSEWEKVSLGGLKGKLLTWTKLYNLPKGFNQRYLLFGIVELENGLRATGRLSVEHPKTGMDVVARVGLVREKIDEDVYGFIFEKL
ncbi:MAG: DNA-binding protein [Spirochaetes bacterium]|nr:MAG: DNA-binding protein [Spirochaetota bacterium]